MTSDEAEFGRATVVSRETLFRLRAYAALLEKWSPRINLVAPKSLPSLWTRHFLDSAQLLNLAPADARTWCDLGTGAGFPGLVVAALAMEKAPGLAVTLIESDRRKVQFLRTVIRESGIPATLIEGRIEGIPPQMADVVSARALAPLPKLLALAKRHVSDQGLCLFPKGAQHESELTEALEVWRFHCDRMPSATDRDAVILRISELSRA